MKFYKPQGQTSSDFPALKEDDFILVILNDAQQEMIDKFGDDIVCMDSTHGLNSYGYELSTLLLIDDNHEGFAGSFMFSSRVDAETIEVFLKTVEKTCRKLKPRVGLSDL